ncbi:hypothetical protein ACES2I_11315 [Bdellovibrio bacteriovorus]|uniref:hypothetical protein n=1 Tax=Bdellovibrio bacteriovorus TaxID=959 RepID=UPI0035A6AA4E
MNKILVSLLLLCSGCLINPKHTDSKTMLDEQIRQNPRNADEIRRQQREHEEAQNIIRAKSNSKAYTMTQEKISSWSLGDPNAAIHVGNSKYKYHHKISFKLICGRDSIFPTPFSDKKVKWNISESISGAVHTSRQGEANIYFITDTGDYFHKITITTDKKSYTVSLAGTLLIELDQSECL